MHGDEPDNAQTFAEFWKGDKEKIKKGWPEIYRQQGLAKRDYKGYGPPVPPRWIVRDYEQAKASDPTRPIFVGLGQGVAWEKYDGRGERQAIWRTTRSTWKAATLPVSTSTRRRTTTSP